MDQPQALQHLTEQRGISIGCGSPSCLTHGKELWIDNSGWYYLYCMAKVNPYLNFPGTTEAAFNLYRSAFGGEFSALHRFAEFPGAENLSAEDRNKLVHIRLPIGKESDLMGSDTLESMGNKYVAGTNNFAVSIQAESKEEADRLFKALAEGGNITMALSDVPWNAYFGMFHDKFGIPWMINYEYPKR